MEPFVPIGGKAKVMALCWMDLAGVSERKKHIPVLSLQKEPAEESFQRWKVARGRQSVIPALLHAS